MYIIKKIITFSICLSLFGKPDIVLCQNTNYIPNYSFENLTACPNNFNQLNLAFPWINPTLATPDLLNACNTGILNTPNTGNGYQKSRTGVGHAYIYTYDLNSIFSTAREYVQVAFKNPLESGKRYCIEFYVSLVNGYYRIATNNIGAYISNANISAANGSNLPYTPQILNTPLTLLNDTVNWMKISGIYVSSGNEQYITIGNFYDDNNTSLIILDSIYTSSSYFIDDVSLHEIAINAGTDTTVCDTSNSFLTIGELNLDTAFKAYYWYDANNNLIDSAQSTITVNPQASTSYVLKKELCETLYDTVNITILNCKGEKIYFEIPNIFTPNGDGVNDVLDVKIGNTEVQYFEIYNRWGVLIFKSNITNLTSKIITWSGRTTSGIECSDGVYYYVVKAKEKNGKELNQKGFITLSR